MSCRLCLSQSIDAVPIFTDIEENNWMDLIYKYLFLKIQADDIYSTNICRQCSKTLEEFNNFYHHIQNCQLRLKTMNAYAKTKIDEGFILKKEDDQDEYEEYAKRELAFEIETEILEEVSKEHNMEEVDPIENVLNKETEYSNPFTLINPKNVRNASFGKSAKSNTSFKDVHINMPATEDFDQYLKENNDNAKMLRMFMFGVSNIVGATETKLTGQISDLSNRIDSLTTEVRSIKKQNRNFKEPYEQTNDESNTAIIPKLPLTSVEEVKKFNFSLQDPEYYDAALQYLQAELHTRTNSTAMYTRRLQLKKIMFGDPVLSQFTWKIPSGKKVHIFSKLKEILRLFVEVINSNVIPESATSFQSQDAGEKKEKIRNVLLDDRSIATYFMETLKRDGKHKDGSTIENPAKIAKAE